ncbi:MAG TPA: nicotinate-nucleotide adenylyltransferase [Ruminiclostridium sp.]|nr:nicotinate-nucleotide adenylyltransferase [Ruminiclostridium sp.]
MIGLMGGTFNPIHYGHLLMCDTIREEFKIEKIIFMPAKNPPHKDLTEVVNAGDRFEMVRLAIKDNPHFEVSDIEMKRPGASYTVDTLRALAGIYGPDKKPGLIIGADSLLQIKAWKSYQEILSLAVMIVASRPDTDEERLAKTIDELEQFYHAQVLKSSSRAMDYSSTEIRERVHRGLSIKYRVPPGVEAYIYEKGLYR